LFAGSGHGALEKARRQLEPGGFPALCLPMRGPRSALIEALGNETLEQIAADPVPGRRRLDALRLCLAELDPVQRELLDDRMAKVTFDRKANAGEMRGDAFFVIGIARNSPPGGQIYVDEISLKLPDC
jgi:hypothetical protein